MKKITSLFIAVLCLSLSSYAQKTKAPKLEDGIYAEITTDKGVILIKLEHEKTPITVSSFVGLAEGNFRFDTLIFSKPFYDSLKFHRVINDFMIQGGDPAGTGSGGPGYAFIDEIDTTLKHDGPGVLSMANSGPSTNGSQFFITHKETPWLDGKHTVFGHVVSGQDVVNKIQQNDYMLSVKIIRVGKKAKKFNATKTFEEEIEKIKERERKELAERNDTFRAEFKDKYPKATQTESGLMYIVEKEGEGEKPKVGQNVFIHYTGLFPDGKKFDSSYDRGEPLAFLLGQKRVIGGWDEGIALMNKNAEYTLIIPYWLAYGDRGYPGLIPPKSTLIFEVKLVDFK